jgi:hypothetical protein
MMMKFPYLEYKLLQTKNGAMYLCEVQTQYPDGLGPVEASWVIADSANGKAIAKALNAG